MNQTEEQKPQQGSCVREVDTIYGDSQRPDPLVVCRELGYCKWFRARMLDVAWLSCELRAESRNLKGQATASMSC